MPNGSRRDRAAAAVLAVWVAVLSMVAGYAETADQRLVALALVLVLVTAGAPALAASKNVLAIRPESGFREGALPPASIGSENLNAVAVLTGVWPDCRSRPALATAWV